MDILVDAPSNICLFLPCPCPLNTVILLWTLYCTKHRNWFHASLMMIEIFTELPLKVYTQRTTRRALQ